MPSLPRIALLVVGIATMAYPAFGDDPERPAAAGLQANQPADGRFVKTELGYMVPYKQRIPGSLVEFEMIPVPGGIVKVGQGPKSDDAEQPCSQPMLVELEPYWIASHEVSWEQYWLYMELYRGFEQIQAIRNKLVDQTDTKVASLLEPRRSLRSAVEAAPSHVDGVTAPTPLYEPPITYMAGKEPNLPAATMSPYAAKQYTKWLSLTTGADFRLPSEAEWEHAALAGGTSPYGIGADGEAITTSSLGDYAWFADNARDSDDGEEKLVHQVGEKKPNAWGLYDVLGNVAEWVLDEHREDQPESSGKPLAWKDAIAWPRQAYPRIAKGGACGLGPADCRVVSRLASDDEEWKYSDPNFPLSPWWFTEQPARGVGFRIVRQLEPMDEETRKLVWEIDHEDIQSDVDARLEERRGKLQRVDRDLPAALKELEEPAVQELLN